MTPGWLGQPNLAARCHRSVIGRPMDHHHAIVRRPHTGRHRRTWILAVTHRRSERLPQVVWQRYLKTSSANQQRRHELGLLASQGEIRRAAFYCGLPRSSHR